MIARDVLRLLVKRFEGCRLHAYMCPAGVWTNGWGSTGKDVVKGVVWTQEQADMRMEADLNTYLTATKKLCPTEEDEVHGAIADFTYNLGATRLAGSTLRKCINSKNYTGAKKELVKWVYAGGRKLPGLVVRRSVEVGYINAMMKFSSKNICERRACDE
jgi:lysozyme